MEDTMSLAALPDYTLGLISCYLDGLDNYSLWLASDSNLRRRLENVITEFEIWYTRPGRYLWPGNFLKKLKRLSRLSLVVKHSLQHLLIEDVVLYPIPDLKYLKIQCKNAFDIFEQTISSDAGDLTGLTSSSRKSYINLNDLFCKLEYLEIGGGDFGHTLSIEFIESLPKNLKSLLLPITCFHLNNPNIAEYLNQHFGLLPRTLTSLNLQFSQDATPPVLDLSKLPPNLTSLQTNATIAETNFNLLPPNITDLELSGRQYNFEVLSSSLPIGLRFLSLDVQEGPIGDNLAHLNHLEELTFNPHGWSSAVGLLTKSPPNLKKFSSSCARLSQDHQNPFIDGLEALQLNQIRGISKNFMMGLPRTITELSLFANGGEPFAFFALLPRCLKSLSTNFSIIENTSLLPDSLTSLRLSPGNSVDASQIDQLPPKLKTLNVCGNFPQAILALLPDTLKDLSIMSRNQNFIIEDPVIGTLPRGLKQLYLGVEDKLTDASADDYPPNLILLNLKNTLMTDDAIPKLPRSLELLDLAHNPNLTDNCVPNLPRSLIFLNIQNSKITPESKKDMPKFIKNLFTKGIW